MGGNPLGAGGELKKVKKSLEPTFASVSASPGVRARQRIKSESRFGVFFLSMPDQSVRVGRVGSWRGTGKGWDSEFCRRVLEDAVQTACTFSVLHMHGVQ